VTDKMLREKRMSKSKRENMKNLKRDKHKSIEHLLHMVFAVSYALNS
jgi:hypothetical protein